MADREARIAGAGTSIEVDGKTYVLRPLDIRLLYEMQREALKFYKRSYLETYASNLDLIPATRGQELMEQKLEEVARWDVKDLPQKNTHDASLLSMTDAVRDRLITTYGGINTDERTLRAALVTALDSDEITVEEVEKLAGRRPIRIKSPYDMWWITGCFEGMITLIWMAVKRDVPGLSKEDVAGWPLGKVIEAAHIIERVTAPSLGNMSGSPS